MINHWWPRFNAIEAYGSSTVIPLCLRSISSRGHWLHRISIIFKQPSLTTISHYQPCFLPIELTNTDTYIHPSYHSQQRSFARIKHLSSITHDLPIIRHSWTLTNHCQPSLTLHFPMLSIMSHSWTLLGHFQPFIVPSISHEMQAVGAACATLRP